MTTTEIDWERLAQLGLKLDENRRHEVMETLKCLDDLPPIGWRSPIERYVEGTDEIHIHIGLKRSGREEILAEFKSRQLCARFNWPEGTAVDDANLRSRASFHPPHGGTGTHAVEPDLAGHEGDRTVLVSIPEFVKYPERMPLGMLPASKRLQPLQACRLAWGNAPQAPSDFVLPVWRRRGIDDDRELDPSSRTARWEGIRRETLAGDGQPESEVIQGAPQIVDDLANDDSPFFSRMFSHLAHPELGAIDQEHCHLQTPSRQGMHLHSDVDALGGGKLPRVLGRIDDDDFLEMMTVWLDDNGAGVTLDEMLDSIVQCMDVFLSPSDFGECAGERTTHGVDISQRQMRKCSMPNRSSRPKHADFNQLAASIVDEATDLEPASPAGSAPEKNPHAVALGRSGGLKGGKARAEKMTPEQRREAARKAAAARWHST